MLPHPVRSPLMAVLLPGRKNRLTRYLRALLALRFRFWGFMCFGVAVLLVGPGSARLKAQEAPEPASESAASGAEPEATGLLQTVDSEDNVADSTEHLVPPLPPKKAEHSPKRLSAKSATESASETAALTEQSAARRNDGLEPGMFQRGLASYYADKFHGRSTASGEHFDMNDMTAAHKTLPFGTVISVANLRNDKNVTVRINDRGPFLAGRIVDVSKRAAEMLEMLGAGVVPAEIVILALPAERQTNTKNSLKSLGKPIVSSAGAESGTNSIPAQGRFAIQIASYSKLKYANRHLQRLEAMGIPIHLEQHGKFYRLIVVNLNKEQLAYYRSELARLGIGKVLVRQE